MKIVAMIAALLVGIAGTAAASFEATVDAQIGEETHQLYVFVADDGTATILVDGEPLGAPEAPELPGIPTLP